MKTNKIVERDGKFYITNKNGKGNLGKKDGYATKEEADKRLKEVEFFKQENCKVNVSFVTHLNKSQIKDNGDSYMISQVPVTVDDAVMNGIKYTAEENRKGMPSLRDKPITLGHPKEEGNFIDAFNGKALQDFYSGGRVVNTYNYNGVNYVDMEIKKAILNAQDTEDNFFSNALQNKEPIGVSTGVYIEMANAEDSDDFDGYAINQDYNHLAMLHSSEPPAGGESTFMRFNEEQNTMSITVNLDDVIELSESSNEKRRKIESVLTSMLKKDDDEYFSVWVRDFDDSVVIFSDGESMKSANYSFSDGRVVVSDISEVREKSVFEKVKTGFANAVKKMFDGQNNDGHNNQDDFINNANEDSSMREAYLAALGKANIQVNSDISDSELLAKYEEMQANKLAKSIGEHINGALEPVANSIAEVKTKLEANENAEKADLVAKTVEHLGIAEDDAKAMSVNALKAIAEKAKAPAQTLGLNSAYSQKPADNGYQTEMPE